MNFMNLIILLPIILSVFFAIYLRSFKTDAAVANCGIIATVIISLSIFCVLYFGYGTSFTLLSLFGFLGIGFNVDGLTVVFSLMVAILWPIASYYAKTYMIHEGRFKRFFSFYILTYGTVFGLALSGNLFTLYLFYELLSFITLPLVLHNGEKRDIYAGKSYLVYMIFGASLSFVGMMLFGVNVGNFDFAFGGITTGMLNDQLLIAFILMFIGFAVKTGMFPFSKWLVTAGVAPTTVTALLHAVAVVKSGAFATMRVTYYLYDFTELRYTYAHIFVISLVTLSVVFGSFMATRALHIKRRLAYSTVSQLSYILLGVSTMSPLGLLAALMHMIFHAFTKIVLFYGAGNVLFTNHAQYLDDIRGYGKVMKTTFITFVICAVALIGVPPFGSFFSKFLLAQSAISVGGISGFLAVCALIISAFFTAIYLFQIIIAAFMPPHDFTIDNHVKPAPKPMRITVIVLTALMICLSIGSLPLYNFISGMILGGV